MYGVGGGRSSSKPVTVNSVGTIEGTRRVENIGAGTNGKDSWLGRSRFRFSPSIPERVRDSIALVGLLERITVGHARASFLETFRIQGVRRSIFRRCPQAPCASRLIARDRSKVRRKISAVRALGSRISVKVRFDRSARDRGSSESTESAYPSGAIDSSSGQESSRTALPVGI